MQSLKVRARFNFRPNSLEMTICIVRFYIRKTMRKGLKSCRSKLIVWVLPSFGTICR